MMMNGVDVLGTLVLIGVGIIMGFLALAVVWLMNKADHKKSKNPEEIYRKALEKSGGVLNDIFFIEYAKLILEEDEKE